MFFCYRSCMSSWFRVRQVPSNDIRKPVTETTWCGIDCSMWTIDLLSAAQPIMSFKVKRNALRLYPQVQVEGVTVAGGLTASSFSTP